MPFEACSEKNKIKMVFFSAIDTFVKQHFKRYDDDCRF